jgi:putative membrane protein
MVSFVVNFVRGALMGIAEVVPGVGAGTVALIAGVYRTLIDALADGFLAIRQVIGLAGGRPSFHKFSITLRSLPWRLLLPLGAGAATAFLLMARLMESLLEDYPTQMRGLFFGLVLTGVYVPFHIVLRIGRARFWDILIALGAFALAFSLTGVPPERVIDPNPLFVFLGAVVAGFPWVLPGVSGSFFLYSIGLYQPTIAAVNDLDLAYLAVFGIGVIVGLGTFVGLFQWLLAKHARLTWWVVVGLMLGSLRALWPWQNADRDLLAPAGDVGSVLLFFGIGVVFVSILLVLEHRYRISEEDVDLDSSGAPRAHT